ncbi:hypothetical protein MPS_3704 [Mycobacterium pseudoshottsii JCM 15466]|uniref:Uncharacterized protein n=1 Tax=Mycobacterium pseudoshottsii TaxID=265949 RepID=A0A9N7LPW0_9MYCO|nr:hypothetical protein MMSP_4589 [Mycobacterium sp. 012931]MBC9861493.1 hypothetical protein [Mycobacterium pseudoshottsii]BBA87230.1 hypothetical protein MPSD_16140 [Mycobacterium pseudoshottsii JCM 15466]BDN81378.1 hypothetical protein NJB1907Z4_C15930 [Mycobacterium pseudoshottsii]GAQ37468.1 hypothetical protein MPS_3704 [Mycobacterium pseudoshottsii JCM 15466]
MLGGLLLQSRRLASAGRPRRRRGLVANGAARYTPEFLFVDLIDPCVVRNLVAPAEPLV